MCRITKQQKSIKVKDQPDANSFMRNSHVQKKLMTRKLDK